VSLTVDTESTESLPGAFGGIRTAPGGCSRGVTAAAKVNKNANNGRVSCYKMQASDTGSSEQRAVHQDPRRYNAVGTSEQHPDWRTTAAKQPHRTLPPLPASGRVDKKGKGKSRKRECPVVAAGPSKVATGGPRKPTDKPKTLTSLRDTTDKRAGIVLNKNLPASAKHARVEQPGIGHGQVYSRSAVPEGSRVLQKGVRVEKRSVLNTVSCRDSRGEAATSAQRIRSGMAPPSNKEAAASAQHIRSGVAPPSNKEAAASAQHIRSGVAPLSNKDPKPHPHSLDNTKNGKESKKRKRKTPHEVPRDLDQRSKAAATGALSESSDGFEMERPGLPPLHPLKEGAMKYSSAGRNGVAPVHVPVPVPPSTNPNAAASNSKWHPKTFKVHGPLDGVATDGDFKARAAIKKHEQRALLQKAHMQERKKAAAEGLRKGHANAPERVKRDTLAPVSHTKHLNDGKLKGSGRKAMQAPKPMVAGVAKVRAVHVPRRMMLSRMIKALEKTNKGPTKGAPLTLSHCYPEI
jgi:hypothetical protein